MNQKELNEIIALHLKWLNGEIGGKQADLSNADLSNTNLRNANLSYADLSNTSLRNTNLSYTNLSYTDLGNANLSNTNLRNTNLRNANLLNANLSNTNLRNAKNILSFIGEKHLLVYFKYNSTYYFKIGCKTFPIDYWLKNFKDIGNKEGYSKESIMIYGDIMRLFSKYDLEG